MSVQSAVPPFHLVAGRILFDGTLRAGRAVRIEDGHIAGVGARADVPDGAPVVDLGPAAVLAPGFIDWQVNGGGGVNLNDDPSAATAARIAAAHRRFGATRILPTLITDRPEVMAALAEHADADVPGVLGWHLEGPFLNPERKGIHRADLIRPLAERDADVLKVFAAKRSVVTLAPELAAPGAIAALVAAGLVVSLGHSAAHATDALRAADEGATAVTHLFNAMSQMNVREPGIVGTALDDRRFIAGMIADGIHIAPANMRTAYRAMGVERLSLVTDAMAPLGQAAGEDPTFQLMGREIRLSRDPVHGDRLTGADGTLAGAHLSMIEAVERTVRLIGAPLADALAMASATPAKLLGVGDRFGRIAAGYVADLVAFDADFRILATWRDGISEV
jgi:N-acetylglucosamine-6-phosphate deacetylase